MKRDRRLVLPKPSQRGPLLAALLLLGGCAVVPEPMQVATGNDPKNVDRDVRFRTTHYFRVFDYCDGMGGDDVVRIPYGQDALYRFRLTGKANSLTNTVHFESGTLTAAELDPLGARVVFDDESGHHFLESAQAMRERQRLAELKRLTALYEQTRRNLHGEQAGESAAAQDQAVLAALAEAVKGQSARLSGPTGRRPGAGASAPGIGSEADGANAAGNATGNGTTGRAQGATPQGAAGSTTATTQEAPSNHSWTTYCSQPKRGFQILGPEGWRTFDQEERLVFAMSSSAQPLIGTLKELGSRVLESQPKPERTSLQLLRAQIKTDRAAGALAGLGEAKAQEMNTKLQKAIEAFKGDRAEDNQ